MKGGVINPKDEIVEEYPAFETRCPVCGGPLLVQSLITDRLVRLDSYMSWCPLNKHPEKRFIQHVSQVEARIIKLAN